MNPATGKPSGVFILARASQWAYATLALGSALALFVYPHAVTGVLSGQAARRDPAQHGACCPPTRWCSGCIALLGYMALARPA